MKAIAALVASSSIVSMRFMFSGPVIFYLAVGIGMKNATGSINLEEDRIVLGPVRHLGDFRARSCSGPNIMSSGPPARLKSSKRCPEPQSIAISSRRVERDDRTPVTKAFAVAFHMKHGAKKEAPRALPNQ